jgi:phosphate transport system substrate-binding protein
MAFLFIMGISCLTAASESLVIAGTGDSQTLLRNLAELYEKIHPPADIIVPDSVGSGGGIKAVVKGTAGMGRTARALTPEEKDHDLTAIPIALSPIVFAANPNVAEVKNISSDDIMKIYSGAITNWRELGGEDHKIYPVDREPGDSSRKILEAKLKSSSGTFKAVKPKAKVFYSTPEAAQAVAQNRYTIGYLPLSIAREAQLHVFSVNHVFPDETNVRNHTYPLVTTFYLVKPADPSGLAKEFLSFMQEGPAQQLMISSGVVPLEKIEN